MLEGRFGPWLPSLLRRRLLRAEAEIEDAVRAFAALLPRGSRVLDAGAGEGRHRALFAHCRYSGVDRAIGDPRWDYSQLDSIADLSELPFADESFDALINLVVLEHVFEPDRVLKEFARVLKPGARALIAVPLAWEVHQAPHDYFRYTCHGLRRLLTEAGLRVETIRPVTDPAGIPVLDLPIDSLVSLDLRTGEKKWALQAVADDFWTFSCIPMTGNLQNCPVPTGTSPPTGYPLGSSRLPVTAASRSRGSMETSSKKSSNSSSRSIRSSRTDWSR